MDTLMVAILVVGLLNFAGVISSFVLLYSQLRRMHETQTTVVKNNTMVMNSVMNETHKLGVQVTHLTETLELGNRIGEIEKEISRLRPK